MCKIRIIKIDGVDLVKMDELCPFDDIHISPLDLPSNIKLYKTPTLRALFSYPGDKEFDIIYNVEDTARPLSILFGENSGRVKSVNTKLAAIPLSDTDIFAITLKMKSENKNVRYNTNIREFAKLIKQLLQQNYFDY